MNNEEFTNTRIHRETLKILRRYAAIHHLTAPRFFDNLASLLICGLSNLDNDELTIKDLQEIYRYSSLMVCEDMRRFNAPLKETSK